MREQHGSFGGVPTVTLSKLPNKSRQTPSLRAFSGQEAAAVGVGFGVHAVANEAKMMLRERTRASDG